MKKILILGGEGFIGGALVRALMRGHKVVSFDRNLPEKKEKQVRYVQADFFNNQNELKKALKNIDVVVHCISTTVPSTSKHVNYELTTNVQGTVRLLDLMVQEKVPKLCYLSSGGTIYGDSNRLHREHYDLSPGCPYGLGKVLNEEIITYYTRHRLINSQIWRLSNPYGDLNKKNKAQGVIEAFVNNILEDKPLEIWGDGTAIRDYIYIDDAVEAMKILIESGPGLWNETINISTGSGVSVQTIVEHLTESMPEFYDKEIVVKNVGKFTGPKVAVISPQFLRDNTNWRPNYSIDQGITKMLRDHKNA